MDVVSDNRIGIREGVCALCNRILRVPFLSQDSFRNDRWSLLQTRSSLCKFLLLGPSPWSDQGMCAPTNGRYAVYSHSLSAFSGQARMPRAEA
eukprot:1159500-Pelagomonas_calceolata.AAC.2